jgi:thymidylate synthase (FAD)
MSEPAEANDLEPTGKAIRLERPIAPDMDAVLGEPIKVLDDGFVRVVDYMGTDSSIVQAARVSYGEGTRKVHEDRGLIRYLLRHRHTTPFEMCEIKFHVRVPMDCWRQWIRHRTANVNEYSTRYSIAIDASQRTAPEAWRAQAKSNRQGSAGFLDPETGAELTREEQELQDRARAVYDSRLEKGVAREQARKDLPLATYTEAYWKVDLHNLLHFLALRMDEHAQFEIREYARIIGNEVVARWVPLVWEAFQDYRMQAAYLTRLEAEIMAALTGGDPDAARAKAESFGWLKERKEGGLRRNRERAECEAKLIALGLKLPWMDA